MGFPILVRCHLYIESGSRACYLIGQITLAAIRGNTDIWCILFPKYSLMINPPWITGQCDLHSPSIIVSCFVLDVISCYQFIVYCRREHGLQRGSSKFAITGQISSGINHYIITSHFGEIFNTGCTRSYQNDNFRCSQWWKLHQNEEISFSVISSWQTSVSFHPSSMSIIYFHLPYFHVSNSALFSTWYFSTLILYRHSLDTLCMACYIGSEGSTNYDYNQQQKLRSLINEADCW